MRGFDTLPQTDAPNYKLPDDWTGMKICLKWTGGVGDVLMAVGGAALALKKKDCHITACVMPHHVPLIEKLEGVDTVIPGVKLNQIQVRNSFEVIIDFAFSINNSKEIRKGKYYELLSNHIGLNLSPGRFKSILRKDKSKTDKKSVHIHPSASNPNRRWDDAKWKNVAYKLRDWGYHVVWIGTKDEYGFSDDRITKLSDTSDDLVWQVEQIADSADYFIGCDSGFAHVCGLLGIQGLVLFFTTDSESVIGMYPSMRGLDCYAALGAYPTRTLKSHCAVGSRCSNSMTANDVLRNCQIPIIEELNMPRDLTPANQLQIGICGATAQTDVIANFLAQSCRVEILDVYPEYDDEFDIFVEVSDDKVKIITPGGIEATVNANHPENIKRAIREILGRG